MDETCFQCGARLYCPVDGSQPTECPDCCSLCGEMADAESTEYYDPQRKVSLPGHAQCILDAGFQPA